MATDSDVYWLILLRVSSNLLSIILLYILTSSYGFVRVVFIILFIYVLCIHWLCWDLVAVQFSLVALSRDNSLVVVRGFLTVMVSLVVEHRL